MTRRPVQGLTQTDYRSYPAHDPNDSTPGSPLWVEFEAMINVRPAKGNRTRGVESSALQERIRRIVQSLVPD